MIADKEDCCFERGVKRFRFRVGAIIIEDGCVLLVTNDRVPYYYSVGGGVHLGEATEDAVRREVAEETGVDYEPERIAFVHENFYTEKHGYSSGSVCHEISLYYLMKPRGTKEIKPCGSCPDGREYLEWVPISELKTRKVFPAFFADRLAKLEQGVGHIVTKD